MDVASPLDEGAATRPADPRYQHGDALTALVALTGADLEACNRTIVARMESPIALIPQLAAHIVAAGCAVQLDPAKYEGIADRVLGNEHKMQVASFAPAAEAPVLVSDIMTVRETAEHFVEGFEGRGVVAPVVAHAPQHIRDLGVERVARAQLLEAPLALERIARLALQIGLEGIE